MAPSRATARARAPLHPLVDARIHSPFRTAAGVPVPAGLPPFPSPATSSSLFENRVARPGAYLKGAEAPSPIKTAYLAQWLP